MAMDDPYAAPRRAPALLPIVVALFVAFLLGLALAAWVVRRSDRVAQWLHPVTPPAPVRVVVPVPTAVPAPPLSQPQVATQEELSGRLATIESRIDAIDARAAAASGDADRADGLLVTFAARRQIDRGVPLGYLEGMLRDRFGANEAPAVTMVIAAAQAPVTLTQLQDGLAALAPAITVAKGQGGWWAATRAQLAGLVVVRREGAPSTVPADRVARAQHALAAGQVDAAAAEVSRLPGAARAAGWLQSARRWSLAHQALDRLETAALLKPRPQATAVSTAD